MRIISAIKIRTRLTSASLHLRAEKSFPINPPTWKTGLNTLTQSLQDPIHQDGKLKKEGTHRKVQSYAHDQISTEKEKERGRSEETVVALVVVVVVIQEEQQSPRKR